MRWLAVALIALLAVPAAAQTDSGDVRSLLRSCKSAEGSVGAANCLGYVTGFVEGMAADPVFCPSEPIPYKRMVETFIAWAEQNPNKAEIARRVGVMAALVERWPCKRK